MAKRVLLAVGLMALAGAAQAQIDFGKMPVGCNWTLQYSDGQAVTETFQGKRAGGYVTRTTQAANPKVLVRTTTYDAKGRMTRKDWANGKWETFAPFSCFGSPGACTHRYRNADGADQKIASSTTRNGKGYAVTFGPVGGAPYADDYFELGTYGVMIRNTAGEFAARLIAQDNCSL